ncbi:MAG: peptidoglycan bridge formation glycyltransferase FemA/FemB family protein [Candidatus Wildermuthbacteria bacterium]|nr:peptidoglycan bridge formation glycyltransferase FemA/FemB family protein [Candidatus Wildermuthbacteria bacterium]
MTIQEISDRRVWEQLLLACEEKSFLHSWEWGEFCQSMGETIWRYGVYEAGELCAGALVEKKAARRGTFLLVPHGPVVKSQNILKSNVLEILLQELKTRAKEGRAGFIRINPIWERSDEHAQIFRKFWFKRAPLQMHPESSWKLDISPDEGTLFTSMRKTTRYLIRQAQNNPDIVVFQSGDPNDVRVFSAMHNLVSERQRFIPFSKEYLQKEFDAFAPDGVRIFWGTYKGERVAGSFVIFKDNAAFYHHAVSLPEFAKFSIPALVQWEAIREAKRRGCAVYDFWGFVDPATNPAHPWAGPTLFKMGFGGYASLYAHTQDLPLRWTYWLTYCFEALRRKKRHL